MEKAYFHLEYHRSMNIQGIITGLWTNWSDWSIKETAFFCFFIAIIIRILIIPFSIITGLNPYTQADAIGFATAAEQIASLVVNGSIFVEGMGAMNDVHGSSTYHRWGSLLALFWLIPGPSLIYATMGISIIGAGAVYNVARITGEIATRRAALFAAAPITFYPSFIFIHTVILREAAVLFCVSTIAMLLITRTLKPIVRFFVSILLALIALLLRPELTPLIILAILASLGLRSIVKRTHSITAVEGSVTAASLGGIAMIPYIASLRNKLLGLREVRFRGRTQYIESVPLETAIDSLIWGILMGLYFILTPFPWMIETVADFGIFLETIITFGMIIGAFFGFRFALQTHPAIAGGLLLTFIIGIVVFGLGTANVGTAVRHRQMFLWILFVFGGIGIDYLFGVKFEEVLEYRLNQYRNK